VWIPCDEAADHDNVIERQRPSCRSDCQGAMKNSSSSAIIWISRETDLASPSADSMYLRGRTAAPTPQTSGGAARPIVQRRPEPLSTGDGFAGRRSWPVLASALERV